MRLSKLILTLAIGLFILITLESCNEENKESKQTETVLSKMSKEEIENEAWEMEVKYWDYAQKMDTVAYKKLWHNDFIGRPGGANEVYNKSKVTNWIPELHSDQNLKFSYKLYRKATNAIGDVVMVFYDVDNIWTDKENNIISKETYEMTHTWKKYDYGWVILGGMSADKNEDILND
ncbi:nuclear transport factor 2 family protein [Maribacter sp. ACAM166]|uniref:nuclear transport factor 2 family protein n=1 Tax=Maribacter sp. ACAM166 TaxID=2508996 RepID=UPI0010FD6254|nr:nuclear transport factor 2 family protein [Maribacter sp. ACAM166]TLP71185.1 nuclear transport factor 2 family protein [Maribacter sp. ACAM166]